MKIYKSCYRNHWISPYTIIDYVFFWTDWSKCARDRRIRSLEEESRYIKRPDWTERCSDYLNPVSRAIQWALDRIHPQINYVKINRWDTWSMDHTLADIILPMLKQLKETKHGAPFTEDDDVPEYLRSYMAQPKENEWDTDSLHFLRWDWILDEMIWAFEQKVDNDSDSQFFDHSAYKDNKIGTDTWLEDLSNGVSKTKYDKEGHQKWQERKSNGFRLFGKYYENLWD
jgi:hypothetical protein